MRLMDKNSAKKPDKKPANIDRNFYIFITPQRIYLGYAFLASAISTVILSACLWFCGCWDDEEEDDCKASCPAYR